MSATYEDAEGLIPSSINILDVLRGIGRRRLMIAGITIIAFLGAVAAVGYMSPVYTTESQVLVESLATPFDQVASTAQPQVTLGGADSRDIDTQIAVARSDDIGRRVVAALKLAENPGYNTQLRGMGKVSQLKVMLGFSEDPRLQSPEDLALNSYKKGLTIYQLPNSNVIAIKISASDPKLAASIANTLAQTYVTYTREVNVQPTERARQWLAQQIDQLRAKVADAEAAVEKFRAEAGLLQGTNTTTLGNQQLSELNSQITLAEAAKTDARSRADSIRSLLASKGTVDASADVLASAVIQGLKQQQTEAQRNVAELSAVYLANHPKMIAAQKQLDNINRRIRAEALKIVEGLEEQASIAETRETSLRNSLEDLKRKAGGANLNDVKLKALERDAQASRALLESMLARYAEATAHLDPSAQPGRAQVIQQAAVPPSPSFPKTGPMVLLITIAGLSLSLGLAFLLEIMAAAARLNARVARAMRASDEDGAIVVAPVRDKDAAPPVLAPVAASVPPPPVMPPAQGFSVAPPPAGWQPPPVPQPPLAVFPAATAPGAVPPLAAIDVTLAWFRQQLQGRAGGSLAIVSLGGNTADCPSAALALARSLAGRGSRVIVVDLAADGAPLQQASGAGDGPGIADLVTGGADFTKVISRDAQSAAHVLRYGHDFTLQARGLLPERFPPVLAALNQSYETVIVNLGEAAADTPQLLRMAQAALLLAPPTRLGDVTKALAALRSSGYAAVQHLLIGPPQQTQPRPDVAAAAG
jgi:uncharacterized protein involved in exopolysaccharide biosynthesis/Mrp family chromosome partitioning ATPase